MVVVTVLGSDACHDAWVAKPFSSAHLLGTVARALEASDPYLVQRSHVAQSFFTDGVSRVRL